MCAVMGQQSEEERAQHTSLGGPCVQRDGAGGVGGDADPNDLWCPHPTASCTGRCRVPAGVSWTKKTATFQFFITDHHHQLYSSKQKNHHLLFSTTSPHRYRGRPGELSTSITPDDVLLR